MDTNSLLMALQDKMPKDAVSAMLLRDKLDKASEAKKNELMQILPMLNLKSPALVFWVGCFLLGWLGVGRFMVGDIVLGVLRLVLGLTDLSLALVVRDMDFDESIVLVFLLVNLADIVWWIVDMFLVGKKARQQNLEKVLQIIA